MIDGKPYDVDIVMAENGSCSILHDGNSFNAELIRGEGGKSYDVNMFYRSYHVDIVDTQTKYLRMKTVSYTHLQRQHTFRLQQFQILIISQLDFVYQINHFFQKKRIKYTGFHRMLDATVQINSQHTF